MVRTDTTTTVTPHIHTYFSFVRPSDPTFLHRLVGFYEYTRALQNLDALVKTVNKAELAAIDEIVKESAEFAVFTNLARHAQTGKSRLDEKPIREFDNFERRGLAWVMALARIEVGAMFAAFNEQGPNPLERMNPTELELEAYTELLLDGARTHYWALVRDPLFLRMAGKSAVKPDHQTTAYTRRLKLARAFLYSSAKAAAPSLSPEQVAELTQWKQKLEQTHFALTQNIQRYLDRNSGFTGSTTRSSTTRRTVEQ